jgi:RHS repeat-associated protein
LVGDLPELQGGAVQTRYTYGTAVVSQTRGVGVISATSYYGYDAHGNVEFLTDAVGNITDTYDYDAWGSLVASTGSTSNTRLFAGEELDPDVGLINLRARQYRSEAGRFVTLDPIGGYLRFPASLNRYGYTSVDPVNAVDPLGTMAIEEGVLDTAETTPNQASQLTVTIKTQHALANEASHFLNMATETTAQLERIIDTTAREIVAAGSVALRAPFLSIVPLSGYDLVFAGFLRTAIWLEVPTYYLRLR